MASDDSDLDEVIEQLSTIEERLRDYAYERLRAATKGNEAAARDERTILKARRAIERAIVALRSVGDGGDLDADGEDFGDSD